jgi:hypothetical protein
MEHRIKGRGRKAIEKRESTKARGEMIPSDKIEEVWKPIEEYFNDYQEMEWKTV